MQTTILDRRLAAWLLTLPGPWHAPSRAEAMRKARRMFDANLSDQDFEAALARVGYAMEGDADALFAITPSADRRHAA